MNKSNRQEAITEVLAAEWIGSQEDLQKALEKRGFEVTQATLSRDMKELQVARTIHPGKGTRYVVQEDGGGEYLYHEVPDHLDGVISVEFSGQFAVVRTLPGFANSVAYTIDRQRIEEIMGTIAGDDTILVILKEGVSSNLLAGVLSSRFPRVAKKFI